jgi:hypothetical protein
MSATITNVNRHSLYTEYTVSVEQMSGSYPIAQTFHVCVVHDSPSFPMCYTTWSRCVKRCDMFATSSVCRRAARDAAVRNYRNHVKANS